MTTERFKPERGQTYFMVSAYNPTPYEFTWNGNKANLAHFAHHTLYRTKSEAEAIIKTRDLDV